MVAGPGYNQKIVMQWSGGTTFTASGLLPDPQFPQEKTRKEIFLTGTEPKTFDTMAAAEQDKYENALENLRQELLGSANMLQDNGITLPPVDSTGTGTGAGSGSTTVNPNLD